MHTAKSTLTVRVHLSRVEKSASVCNFTLVTRDREVGALTNKLSRLLCGWLGSKHPLTSWTVAALKCPTGDPPLHSLQYLWSDSYCPATCDCSLCNFWRGGVPTLAHLGNQQLHSLGDHWPPLSSTGYSSVLTSQSIRGLALLCYNPS